ncbi:MAG: cholest-4-en-3-one 26-monooxygenase, partial [Acidimicrobiaceae bacterium]
MKTRTLEDIDLLEDTWARGVPHDQFDVLRREAPVFWHEHPAAEGFWAVTKHADVKAISHDVKSFSTELGSAFILDQDPMAMEFHRMTLLQMDPPKHNRYRRLVSSGFTPRMITMLIDSIGQQAKRIVGEIEGRDEIEFTMDIAAELPMQAICEMIGIP